MNHTQCRHCVYWRMLSTVHSDCACHYMLDTGKQREHKGDACLSRTIKQQAKQKGFDVPMQQR